MTEYKLLENRNFYFNAFRQNLNEFLAYIKFRAPPPNLNMDLANIHYAYLKTMYTWIGLILDIPINFDNYNYVLYRKLREHFQLNDIPEIGSNQSFDLHVWGGIYWKFLHYGSICTYIKLRETKNLDILQYFGAVLINFGMALLCATCSINYKNLNIIEKFVNPMLLTRDPIMAIFLLHNAVNQHTHNPTYFKFEEFEKLYLIEKIEFKSPSPKLVISPPPPPQAATQTTSSTQTIAATPYLLSPTTSSSPIAKSTVISPSTPPPPPQSTTIIEEKKTIIDNKKLQPESKIIEEKKSIDKKIDGGKTNDTSKIKISDNTKKNY